MNCQYHIQWNAPNDVWPRGGWSVYNMNGDQIAERTVFKEIVDGERVGPHYRGGIVARHPWFNYLGMVEKLEDVTKLIASDKERQIAQAAEEVGRAILKRRGHTL